MPTFERSKYRSNQLRIQIGGTLWEVPVQNATNHLYKNEASRYKHAKDIQTME